MGARTCVAWRASGGVVGEVVIPRAGPEGLQISKLAMCTWALGAEPAESSNSAEGVIRIVLCAHGLDVNGELEPGVWMIGCIGCGSMTFVSLTDIGNILDAGCAEAENLIGAWLDDRTAHVSWMCRSGSWHGWVRIGGGCRSPVLGMRS